GGYRPLPVITRTFYRLMIRGRPVTGWPNDDDDDSDVDHPFHFLIYHGITH
ncbi:hypothetical protein FA15DRAFT_665356, partial [Coprinopsis marcescibilis]